MPFALSYVSLGAHEAGAVLRAEVLKEGKYSDLLHSQKFTPETFYHRSANTKPDALGDICTRGFWIDGQNVFFDTRVFYPHTSSYQSTSMPSLYHRFKAEKKRMDGEQIREVQHGSFTLLVF